MIQTEEQLKLIDLGWRPPNRRRHQRSLRHGGLSGAGGGRARGATVASDLYTVGRTLGRAELRLSWLPRRQALCRQPSRPGKRSPCSPRYDALLSLVVQGHRTPTRRPASVLQRRWQSQLLGVLHQVVALDTGRSRPVSSSLFSPELRGQSSRVPTWRSLPVPSARPDRPRGRGPARRIGRRPASISWPPPWPKRRPVRRWPSNADTPNLQLDRLAAAAALIEGQAKLRMKRTGGDGGGAAVLQLAMQIDLRWRSICFDRVALRTAWRARSTCSAFAIAAETPGRRMPSGSVGLWLGVADRSPPPMPPILAWPGFCRRYSAIVVGRLTHWLGFRFHLNGQHRRSTVGCGGAVSAVEPLSSDPPSLGDLRDRVPSVLDGVGRRPGAGSPRRDARCSSAALGGIAGAELGS